MIEERELPVEVRQTWVLMLVLTALSLIYLYVHRTDANWYHQLSSPPSERFGDLTIYQSKYQMFGTEAFYHTGFPFTYPAPVAFGYKLFFAAGRHAIRAYIIFCTLAFVIPAIFLGRALRRSGASRLATLAFVGTVLATSWPAFLVMDRGNMEVLVWVCLVIAVWAYWTGRGYLAACFFGLAAALKLFPFIFVGLFISRREWRKLTVAILVFLCTSVVSLAFMGPNILEAYRQIAHGIDFFRIEYMSHWRPYENGVDHSIFALVKYALFTYFHHPMVGFLKWLSLYLKVTAIGGVLLYVFVIRKLPILNQILAYSVISILFTAFSGDGTLLHLYYGFALLILLSFKGHVRGLHPILLLLAFCLSFDQFLSWHTQLLEGEVKCIALIAALVVTLRNPLLLPAGDIPYRPESPQVPGSGSRLV